MRSLLKNERLKLYKKVSTWVLAGVVVGLAVLLLLLQGVSEIWMNSAMDSQEEDSWQSNYADIILQNRRLLEETPDDKSLQYEMEKYQYLLDNNIDPSHWKNGLVSSYYGALSDQFYYESSSPEIEDFSKDPTWQQYQEDIETYRRLMEASDWRDYVRLQIQDIQDGKTEFNTPEEKQVQIDIWNMYLDLNIAPITSADYYVGYYSDTPKQTWQQKELESLRADKLALLRNQDPNTYTLLTSSDKALLQEQIDLSTERLKTNTPPVSTLSLYGLMETSLSSFGLLSVFLMVLAGGIISSEFGNGTVKLLLITPHRRGRVFWAKVWILVEILLIATGAMFVLSFLVSGILGGFSGIGDMYMTSLFGRIVRLPYVLVILYKYLLFLLPVLAFGALALMLSATTRKTAVAISVSIILMYAGSMVTGIAAMLSSQFTIPGVKFLLFSNTDLGAYFPSPSGLFTDTASSMMGVGGGLVDHSMSFFFSVGILLLYIFCFMWIARDSFCRRDVK